MVVVDDNFIQLREQKASYFSGVCIIIHSNRVLHHADEEHHATMFVSEGKAFLWVHTSLFITVFIL